MRWLQRLHRYLLPDRPHVGWIPYLWLAYLVFFFFRYYFATPGLHEIAAIAVTLAAFLGLYFNGYWKHGWALLPNILGMLLIGTLWAPHNVGSGVFFIYAASFAAWLGPPRRAALAVAAVVASAMLVSYAIQPQLIFWFPPLLFGTLVGTINIYYAAQDRNDAALRLSQQEVRELARVAERERISRDLHDLLGHTLSVITLKAELAGRLVATEPARARAEIGDVERVSRAALAEVREAVSGMRALGLAEELDYARVALKAAGVDLKIDGKPPKLKSSAEAALAMVLREAVTNVIRHAGAHNCRILLRTEGGEVLLEVRDDGRGGTIAAGSGIDGMRARLAPPGGRLEIASDYGTRVRAWLPI
jgi:two-component system sensor histidine kinase DesK